MKKLISFIVFTFCLGVFTYAQVSDMVEANMKGIAPVKEAKRTISQGNVNAYSIILPKTSKKDVEKEWSSFMKQYKTKTKKQKKTSEYFSDDAKIEAMSNNTVDVYAMVNQATDNDTELTVCFDLGGAFLSSDMHPEKSLSGNTLLTSFANQIAKGQAEDLFKLEGRSLKKLTDQHEDLTKDKEKLEKSIAEYEKKIEEAKKKIEQNIKDQEAKKAEIDKQEEVYNAAKLDVSKFKIGSKK